MAPKMPKGNSTPSQLPNAPLTEVVFEIRWKLDGLESIPEPFRVDPGYHVMADSFSLLAQREGFAYKRSISEGPQLNGYSVDLRFYKTKEKSFPLWQIGPGIFAANDSTGYRWDSYKRLCLKGAQTLIRCYPRMRSFQWTPLHLELRYINSFKPELMSDEKLIPFINANTLLRIDLPTLVTGKLGTIDAGQVVFSFSVTAMKDTRFLVTIGNGFAASVRSIILESKVITRTAALKLGASAPERIRHLEQWLENAHSITSPFFKEFISEDLMKKFRGVVNA